MFSLNLHGEQLLYYPTKDNNDYDTTFLDINIMLRKGKAVITFKEYQRELIKMFDETLLSGEDEDKYINLNANIPYDGAYGLTMSGKAIKLNELFKECEKAFIKALKPQYRAFHNAIIIKEGK